MLTERARAAGFTDAGYQLIYADPPWVYRDRAGMRGAGAHYDVMSVEDIAALPIRDICAPDCVLAMWHVPPQPAEALMVCEAWGFKFKTMKLFNWFKTTKNGLRHWGMGSYTRQGPEDVLLGTRGALFDAVGDDDLPPGAWVAEDCLIGLRGKRWRESAAVSCVVEAPYQGHSRKPDAIPGLLVELFGAVKRIELFARRRGDPAWDYWGNEL